MRKKAHRSVVCNGAVQNDYLCKQASLSVLLVLKRRKHISPIICSLFTKMEPSNHTVIKIKSIFTVIFLSKVMQV